MDIFKAEAESFENEMRWIWLNYHDEDSEVCHKKMDELMCATLSRLGFHEGVRIFEDTKKWYA